MKYNILFILPLLTLATAPCRGQGCKGVYIANENIKIENVRVESMGKKVTLAMTVNLERQTTAHNEAAQRAEGEGRRGVCGEERKR